MPIAAYVHLACHGYAALGDNLLSAELSLGDEEPLSAREILDLGLQARLVVASACLTAVTQQYEALDEAWAFSTALVAAGAAGAVGTLWSVDDYATALFMSRFYEALFARAHSEQFPSSLPPGRPAAALRIAQQWLRKLSAADEDEYVQSRPALRALRRGPHRYVRGSATPYSGSFGAPSYWAGFVLVGE